MDKNHAYKEFARDLKNENFPSLLLLYGEEELQVNWALASLKEKFLNPETISLDSNIFEGMPSLEELIETCETLTMFSERRIVVVEDSGLFKIKKSGLEGDKEELSDGSDESLAEADRNPIEVKDLSEEERILNYLGKLPSGTLLVFKEKKADSRLKIFKKIREVGKAYDFKRLDLRKGDQLDILRKFISKRFAQGGKQLNPNLIDLIIEFSGYGHEESAYSLYNMENDILKIMAHGGEKEISLFDIKESMKGDLDTYVFSFVEALANERKDQALNIFSNMLNEGEPFFKILAILISQYELLYDIRQLLDNKLNSEQIEKKLKAHPYRIKMASKIAARYSSNELKNNLGKLLEIERHCKSGLLTQNLAMEMFIGEL